MPDGRVEIIDYKTGGTVPSQREVDKNLQLTFYALALQDKKDVILSLYYFEEQKKISTTRTKAQLEKAKQEIFEIRKQIEESDFTCSGHIFCQNCEYKAFCGIDS